METYWDGFINKYKDILHLKPLQQILCAFFYYSHDEAERADTTLKENWIR